MHQWAYRTIAHLRPGLKFGNGALTESKIEQNVFCHLVTEAAATVGLDYWFLSLQDINQIVPIGSAFGPLTTRYVESYLSEFQRSCPGIRVQDVSFFEWLTRFYCSGEMIGINARDLAESPINYKWISHEIAYGELARNYTRSWMSLLAGSRKNSSEEKLNRAVAIDKKWQTDLIQNVGQLLWMKVKTGKDNLPPPLERTRRRHKAVQKQKRIDFRFFNINSLGENFWDSILRCEVDPKSRSALFAQIVSRYEYSEVAPEALQILDKYRDVADLKIIKYLFRDYKPLKPKGHEPADLFFPN